MKICPSCQTTYSDDSLRFCMKDGTPLGNFQEPAAFASETEDEATIVAPERSPKMVVPLDQPEPQAPAPPVPPVNQQKPPQTQPQRKSNAGILIALAALGVLALIGIGGFGAWLLLSSRGNRTNEITSANSNANFNQNQALSNSQNPFVDANSNANVNLNLNINANLRTPTPTPTRTPTPTPTPANRNANLSNANSVLNSNANIAANANVAQPTPSPVATPTPQRPAQPSTVSGGVVNGRAINLPKPAYPPAARAIRASGAVNVQVLIDETGRVLSAQAVSGHPLLRAAAESAARQARFQPTVLSGQPVKVSGTIVYNFNIN
ncbi:MAG: energy transducer TonB [Acidobacteriota bacterium]|nr:energy transducer TonB [Acidobacteriota bacterium]